MTAVFSFDYHDQMKATNVNYMTVGDQIRTYAKQKKERTTLEILADLEKSENKECEILASLREDVTKLKEIILKLTNSEK